MTIGNALRDARVHHAGEIAYRRDDVCATFDTWCQTPAERRAEAEAFARKWGGLVADRMVFGRQLSVVIATEDWVY